MSESLQAAKEALTGMPDEDRAELIAWAEASFGSRHTLEQKWGIGASLILDAIERSSDLTQRGVRGVIAEAVFEKIVLPRLQGWQLSATEGEAYDFLLRHGGETVRIQVKLQRTERGQPKFAPRPYPPGMYTVEVQRTRGGTDRRSGRPTRPYRFGEFDLLAVNMQPSTHDWSKFLFVPSAWLVPRADRELIAIFQPVPPLPDTWWTDGLAEALERAASRRPGSILANR